MKNQPAIDPGPGMNTRRYSGSAGYLLMVVLACILSGSCTDDPKYSDQTDKNDTTASIIPQPIVLDPPDNVSRKSQWQVKDSAGYEISREYRKGVLYAEEIWDKRLDLVQSRTFYDNGKLKRYSMHTKDHTIPVGKWIYCNMQGERDSTVDHDRKYRIPYRRAVRIAAQYGYPVPEADVSLTREDGRVFWDFTLWEDAEDPTGNADSAEGSDIANSYSIDGKFILIDTRSGEEINATGDQKMIKVMISCRDQTTQLVSNP